MKKSLLLFVGLTVLAAMTAVQPRTFADIEQSVSDEQITHIKQNCLSAQATMRRLQQNDTGLRLKLGQQYEYLAAKLMAPMNSRIVLNQMNIGGLVETTTTFQNQIETFRNAYQAYGQALNTAVHDDCIKNPQQFYNDVAAARTGRESVRAAVAELAQTLDKYNTQLSGFSKQLKEGTQ